LPHHPTAATSLVFGSGTSGRVPQTSAVPFGSENRRQPSGPRFSDRCSPTRRPGATCAAFAGRWQATRANLPVQGQSAAKPALGPLGDDAGPAEFAPM